MKIKTSTLKSRSKSQSPFAADSLSYTIWQMLLGPSTSRTTTANFGYEHEHMTFHVDPLTKAFDFIFHTNLDPHCDSKLENTSSVSVK